MAQFDLKWPKNEDKWQNYSVEVQEEKNSVKLNCVQKREIHSSKWPKMEKLLSKGLLSKRKHSVKLHIELKCEIHSHQNGKKWPKLI